MCVPVNAGIQDATVTKKIEMARIMASAVRTDTFSAFSVFYFFFYICAYCRLGPGLNVCLQVPIFVRDTKRLCDFGSFNLAGRALLLTCTTIV